MKRIACNLTDCADGFLRPLRYLILDRDPLYTRVFRKMLKHAGMQVVRLAARSPNLNAYAAQFVRSVRSECLARLIPLGERDLRHVVPQYGEHYPRESNHQGLDNDLIEQLSANTSADEGPGRRLERLGGVLGFYYREAD